MEKIIEKVDEEENDEVKLSLVGDLKP